MTLIETLRQNEGCEIYSHGCCRHRRHAREQAITELERRERIEARRDAFLRDFNGVLKHWVWREDRDIHEVEICDVVGDHVAGFGTDYHTALEMALNKVGAP